VNNNVTKKRLLIETIGSNTFNNIRDFFQAIEYEDSEYNIYISKKCYALFLVFEPFLKLNKNKVRCTDIRIPFLADEMKGKKVTIIDDILIHGRTLTAVKRKLSKIGCQVEICVLAINEGVESEIFTDLKPEIVVNLQELKETAKESKQFYLCDDYLWRKISDLIMRSFWVTNTPYSADLPVVRIKQAAINIINEKKGAYKVYQCSNHSMEKMGLSIEYIFNEEKMPKDLPYKNSYFGIMLQKNERIKSFKLLPIIVLDETFYSKDAMFQIYEQIFGTNIKELCNMLHFDKYEIDEDVTTTNIKFLHYSIGSIILQKFLYDIGLDEALYCFDNKNLDYSFGKEFVEFYEEKRVKSLDNCVSKKINVDYEKRQISNVKEQYEQCLQTLKNIVMVKGKQPTYVRKNTQESEKKLRKFLVDAIDDVHNVYKGYSCYTNQKIISYIYARFLKLKSDLDEQELRRSKNRLLGLNIQEMINIVKEKTGFTYEEVLVGFLSQFYLGASTIVVAKGERGYGMYCHAGEQSYKCIVHEFVPLVYFRQRYNYHFVQEVAEKMNKCFLNLAIENYRYFDVPFTLNDYKKYSLKYSENIYDIRSLQEHCKEESSSTLCRLGFALEDYVSKTKKIKNNSDEEILKCFVKYIYNKAIGGVSKDYIIKMRKIRK